MRAWGLVFGSLLLLANAIAGDRDQLSVRMASERVGKETYVFVTANNASADLLCVGSDVFDTKRSHILLKSEGHYVRLLSHADGGAGVQSGVDYGTSYFFLVPHQTRKFYIDDSNFDARAGEYEYRLVFSYFRCRDLASGSNLHPYSVDVTGRVYISGHR